jgi:hypothetical protein
MNSIRSKGPSSFLDLGDFNGSYEIVDIPGKGCGILATGDIAPGQLILAEKAVAAVHLDKTTCLFFLQTNKNRLDYFSG